LATIVRFVGGLEATDAGADAAGVVAVAADPEHAATASAEARSDPSIADLTRGRGDMGSPRMVPTDARYGSDVREPLRRYRAAPRGDASIADPLWYDPAR
jgi:hypothetical protein